jgi:hypothetical protein
MMESLDKQMREYQEIRGWLAGKKPAATGRTWRRRMRDALPVPVRMTMIALAPRAGFMVLYACAGLVFSQTLPLFDALFLFEGPPTGVEMPMRSIIGWLQPVIILVSSFNLGMAGLAWILGGHD